MIHRLSILVALIALLAACGAPAAPSPTAAPAGVPAAFPVTIEHKYGSTVITAPLARIVTVGLTEQDALLALGITPIDAAGAAHRALAEPR